MLDLATATLETFTPLVGQSFVVTPAPFLVTLTLADVRPLGARWPGGKRDPFALTFKGQHGLRIPQRIYHFENDTLGPMEIFITQIADKPDGSLFEAVFN